MNVYEKLGVKTLINAHDSTTLIGGSRMPDEVVSAMVEASKHFVNIADLQEKINERVAALTNNEAALVTNGAAAAMAAATAGCITGKDPWKAARIPYLDGLKNEVIIHRAQRNEYDHAIRQVGVTVVEVGNHRRTHLWELEGAISSRTACIFYFDGDHYSRGALPLGDVIEVAKKKGIPVVVDAAAQLPPVENLWNYTRMGADLALFSGGKTLRGPQASGFLVGKKDLVEACKLNAFPRYSVGRSMKIGREEMVGLLYALKRYVNLDHQKEHQRLYGYLKLAGERLEGYGLRVEPLSSGIGGQTYPRLAVYFPPGGKNAVDVKRELEEGDPSVMIQITRDKKAIVINPLHLDEESVHIVVDQITACIEKR